jgi:hypothetical protein
MLAKRLARHGLVVSTGAFATLLSQHTASASVPPSVLSATIRAVVAGKAISPSVASLTEGVIRAMLLSKILVRSAVLFLVVVLGTGIVFSHTGDPVPEQPAPAQARKDAVKGVFSAKEIADVFRTNEALFDEIMDQEATVTGLVLRIRREGDTYVLKMSSGQPPVLAKFSLDNRKKLAKLIVGQQVTVKGTIRVNINFDEKDTEIYMIECKVVNEVGK